MSMMLTVLYLSGLAFTWIFDTCLWIFLLDVTKTPCQIILSFIYNLFPAVVWPISLPLTIVAGTTIKCRKSRVSTPNVEQGHDHYMQRPESLSLKILKHRLRSSELTIREATEDESEVVQQHTQTSKCAVCMDNVKLHRRKGQTVKPQNFDVAVTRCQHVFHYSCIRNWIFKDQSCPVCRQGQYIEQLRFCYQHSGSPARRTDNKNYAPGKDGSNVVIQTVEFNQYVHKDRDVVISVDLLPVRELNIPTDDAAAKFSTDVAASKFPIDVAASKFDSTKL